MREDLLELCRQVGVAVAQAIDGGVLKKITTEYVVTRADYYPDGLTLGRERENREMWDPWVLNEVVQRAKARLGPRFEEVSAALAKDTGQDLPGVRGYLDGLLYRAGKEVGERGTDADLGGFVDHFLHEVSGGAIRWEGRIWLQNISLDSDRLEIDETVVLRKPRSSDFESADAVANLGLIGTGRLNELLSPPDSILEVGHESEYRPSHLVRRLVNALCLFRLGSCAIIKEKFSADSLLSGKTIETEPLRRPHPRFEYCLAESQCPRLRDFLRQVAPRLPVRPTGHHDEKGWHGLKFYFRALFDSADDEECTSLAVACLDGLLSAATRQELVRLVSQRAAALLRFADLEPPRVYEDVKKAFAIRNAYDHGNQAKPKVLRGLPALTERIADYARLVVLKDLEIRVLRTDEKLTWENLGVRLDESLLDDGVRKELEGQLTGGLWDLASPQHRLEDHSLDS